MQEIVAYLSVFIILENKWLKNSDNDRVLIILNWEINITTEQSKNIETQNLRLKLAFYFFLLILSFSCIFISSFNRTWMA